MRRRCRLVVRLRDTCALIEGFVRDALEQLGVMLQGADGSPGLLAASLDTVRWPCPENMIQSLFFPYLTGELRGSEVGLQTAGEASAAA